MIEIISATRHSAKSFWTMTPLGLSLSRLKFDARYTTSITYNNRKGLPEIYNHSICSAETAEILVFIHDDVWVDDHFFADRIIEGLKLYDVLGVAGNMRILPNQPGWGFIDDSLTKSDDISYLSGAVAHGPTPFGTVSNFGKTPARCELLDGVLLAARRQTLVNSNSYFDPLFNFHFYDLDFCRTARKNGLSLGTYSIAITHSSIGSYGSTEWKDGLNRYREKWKS